MVLFLFKNLPLNVTPELYWPFVNMWTYCKTPLGMYKVYLNTFYEKQTKTEIIVSEKHISKVPA